MRTDQIRRQTAARLGATRASLPSSLVGRQTLLFAGLGRAGARSLGRALRRRVGRGRADDVEPEIAATAAVGRLKAVTMKMGQLAGYLDVGLPEPLRAALSALHTHAQPLPLSHVRRVVEAELGVAGQALARTLEPTPLSTASVGQVHRGALPDGTAVAVKVLHPGLEAIIARELQPATLASRLASWIRRRGQLRPLVAEVRARLLEECDYALEAQRQARFAALFAGHPTIVVPAVHAALSSARVLTSTLVDGVHLDAWLAGAPEAAARDRAGAALVELYVAPLWREGLYDGDPHPGNYLFLGDGRVAFVDFGCAAALDGARAAAARELVRAFFATERPRLGRLWREHAAALGGDLPFLLRMLVGVSAVLRRIGARVDWQRVVEPPAPSAPAPAAPAPSAAATVDTGPYDLVLVDPGLHLIAVIRELRDATGLELRDVKALVDECPRTIELALPRPDADALRARLESAGARVDLRRAVKAG